MVTKREIVEIFAHNCVFIMVFFNRSLSRSIENHESKSKKAKLEYLEKARWRIMRVN